MALTIGGNAGHINYAQDYAQQTINTTTTTTLPPQIQASLTNKDVSVQEEVTRAISELQQELAQQQPQEGLVVQCLRKIRDIAPDVAEVTAVAFANPLAALGLTLSKILD